MRGSGGNRGGFDRGDRDGESRSEDRGRGPPGGLFTFISLFLRPNFHEKL